LDGTAHCTPDNRTIEQIKQMEDAIRNGIITWHAKPFTMLAEVADVQLFEEGIKLSRLLDKCFNKVTIIVFPQRFLLFFVGGIMTMNY